MKLLAIAALVGALIGGIIVHTFASNAAKKVQIERDNERIQELNSYILSMETRVTTANAKAAELASFNKTTAGKLSDALAENSEVAGRIASGDLVPRVRVRTPVCPSATAGGIEASAGSMGDATTAELDPAARQDYHALREGIIRLQETVRYLQGYIDLSCK